MLEEACLEFAAFDLFVNVVVAKLGPITVAALNIVIAVNSLAFMPAFGDAYSDFEIAAVANYVTARFGSVASRVTNDQVAELRRPNGN